MAGPSGQNLTLSAHTSLTLLYSGTRDPSATALSAVPGTLFLGTGGAAQGNLYIKQDRGLTTNWSKLAVDGGAGQIPVLLADPVAPALNQQWFLHVPESGTPGLAGVLPAEVGIVGPVNFDVDSAISADTDKFLSGLGTYAIFFDPTGIGAPGVIVITQAVLGQGLTVEFPAAPGFPTFTQLATALNNWCVGNLSPGYTPPCMTFGTPADGAVEYTFGPISVPMVNDFVAESYTLKIKGAGQVFEADFS